MSARSSDGNGPSPTGFEQQSRIALELESGAQTMRDFIQGMHGTLTTRLGATETRLLSRRQSWRSRLQAKVNAGIYPPTSRQIQAFARAYSAGIADSDIIGAWGSHNLPDEARLHRTLCPSALRIPLTSLDPVTLAARGIQPWSDALADRVVGVVSPHYQEIRQQHSRRESLFSSDVVVLPAFTLRAMGTPLTHGLNLSTMDWSKHLRRLIQTARSTLRGADVVLISAGSYGVPLAHALAENGTPAIYMGGCLQLLFGIDGARWARDPDIRQIRTKSWITGARHAAPLGRKLIEGGAYW
jgi:hypothetical protein